MTAKKGKSEVKTDKCKDPRTPAAEEKKRRGISIKDIPDLRRAVVKVIRGMLNGEIQPEKGKGVVYALNTLLRTFEVEPLPKGGKRYFPYRLVLSAEEVEAMPADERASVSIDDGGTHEESK